ncbi:MAG TPA: acylphosphatase [Thermodesulfobacteriaceae bacterium]|nr:acylphosphatase [Thermodesulfobacteriaceae bacterium]
MFSEVVYFVFLNPPIKGVFYRASTRDKARSLGLTGWVRNLPDGRVELVAEGDADKVDQLILWCNHGPDYSRVERVQVSEQTPEGEFEDFSVRY